MKLLTAEIQEKLQSQYKFESDFKAQDIQAKLFIGSFTWYIMNQDPNDPDYLWAIVRNGDIIEVGSVSLSELESIKVHGLFEVERDLFFTPINAEEVWNRLNTGEHI